MCVAVVTGNGTTVEEETFNRCWYRNHDGFGMMWVEGGMIRTYKTLDNTEAYEKYKSVNEELGDKSPIVLHFRIGTQGPNDIANCHPFFVNPNVAFCHNGVIGQYSAGYGAHKQTPYKWVRDGKVTDSDTVLFNKDVLKSLPHDFVKNQQSLDLIEDFIYGDKIVIMDVLDDEPAVTIINEAKGVTEGGIWYSNSSYKVYKPVVTYNTKAEGCSECCRALYSKVDKERGMCDKCAARTCDVCDTTMPEKGIIKMEFGGKSHSFCPSCLDLSDPQFFGVFDSELSLLNVKVGVEVTSNWSDGRTYFVSKLEKGHITVAYKATNSTVRHTLDSFLRNFRIKETV